MDFDGVRFGQSSVEAHRFRCGACGAISTATAGETKTAVGRTSRAASQEIRRIALERGIEAAAAASGLNAATVSRIVSAMTKADQARASRPCPMIVSVGPRDLTTIATLGGQPVTSFHDIASAAAWIAQQPPQAILADIAAVPMLRGLEGVRIALPRHAFDFGIWKAMPTAGRAFVDGSSGGRRLAMLLGSNPASLEPAERDELDAAAPAGSPARGFIRTRDRLLATHETEDVAEARSRLSEWRGGLDGFWGRAFRSAVEFLDRFEGEILTHPAALTASWPRLMHDLKGPSPVYVARMVANI